MSFTRPARLAWRQLPKSCSGFRGLRFQSKEALTPDFEELKKKFPEAPPDALRRLFDEYERERKAQNRETAQLGGIHQMDTSVSTQADGFKRLRILWKEVGVMRTEADTDIVGGADGWWAVTIDGRRIKALESKTRLIVPSEALAVAIAEEWASQVGYTNKLLMPLTDVASAAQLMTVDNTEARYIDMNRFLHSDNLFYRETENKVARRMQEEMCEPIQKWFDELIGAKTTRFQGLESRVSSLEVEEAFLNVLLDMQMNKYQLVCLHSLAMTLSSISLAMAVVMDACTLERAVEIQGLEEMAGLEVTSTEKTKVQVEEWHGIRDLDLKMKAAALNTVYRMTQHLSISDCNIPEHARNFEYDDEEEA